MLDIQWNPSRKELRVFSGLLIAFCGIVAVIVLRRSGDGLVPAIIAGTGLLVGTCGLAWPSVMRPLYVGWMVAAYPIGWVVSHVLLATIFFLVFTPIGWLLRITGHDPLQRRIERSKSSYWELRPAPRKSGDYFRQY